MADLTEVPGWEPGIYQLETTDPVEGGPAGIDNLQAKQLANRTAYLKQLVETLDTGKQPIDALLTALAALVTAADKMLYFTGADAPALTTLTAYMRTALAAVDAAAARTVLGAASPADIAAAIAALVDTSPAALDTLNELAAALGDDPNFAATMTATLAGKQPLDPDLTAIAALASAADKLPYATGAGAWALTNLTAYARTVLAAADAAAARAALGLTSAAVQGMFRNLRASANGTSAAINVSIDEIAVESAGNAYETLRAVALVIDSASAGANGLDTGALAASTWYSVWVIWNGVTTAGLISLSETAPTLPAGYTHKARVGWIRTDSTANKYPLSFKQTGKHVAYVVTAAGNVTGARQMAAGSAGSTVTPTWVAVATGDFVPPTAGAINLISGGASNAGQMIMAPSSSYGAQQSPTNPPWFSVNQQADTYGGIYFQHHPPMTLESADIYYAASGANFRIFCTGWEDNL